jgi:DNA endonuclease
LFLDAIELGNSTDWNHKRIAAELERRHGVRVPSMTVYFWITRRSSPLGHWNVFELKPSRELAYILGVMRGDGFRTSDKAQGKEEIRLCVRDVDFAIPFNEAIAHVLERERPNKVRLEAREDKDRATFFRVRYSSIQLAEFLDCDLNSTRQFAEVHPADFLQGFFDSDGSSTPNLNRGRLYLRVLGSNTNLETLNYMKRLLLERFRIASSIYIDKEQGYSSLVYHKR